MIWLSRQQVYAEDLPRDDFLSLPWCPLPSVLRDPAFREYSICSYSPDVVSNVYPVAGSQYHSNNSTYCNGSGIVSESAEQTCPIKQESKNISKVSKIKLDYPFKLIFLNVGSLFLWLQWMAFKVGGSNVPTFRFQKW